MAAGLSQLALLLLVLVEASASMLKLQADDGTPCTFEPRVTDGVVAVHTTCPIVVNGVPNCP